MIPTTCNRIVRPLGAAMLVLLVSAMPCWAAWSPDEDNGYVGRFLEKFDAVSPAPALDRYATPQRYDELYLGSHLDAALQNIDNDRGGVSWGLSYRMMSLNEMYRATGANRYLEANLKAIRAVLAARDDRQGLKLWNGEVAPCWGSGKYAERGRAVFAVHTGIIVYPMLDFLTLAKAAPGFAGFSREASDSILKAVLESLAYHDRQWCDGPDQGEGFYAGLNQEDTMEDKPLPGNRLSAMGRSLWYAYKLTGEDVYRERALAIGRYIKHRLIPGPDGAYYWSYWLPLEPVTASIPKEEVNAEDVSHASLTMSLPILLAGENQVFSEADMRRLGKTVTEGFARLNNGVLFGTVNGNPGSNTDVVQIPGRWLRLTPFAREVYPRIADFYLNYQEKPGPLGLALLLRYKPEP